MNHSQVKLLAASLLLALSLPAAAAEDLSANTRFDLSSVQEGAGYDRFIVVYRNGSTEHASPAAAVRRCRRPPARRSCPVRQRARSVRGGARWASATSASSPAVATWSRRRGV